MHPSVAGNTVSTLEELALSSYYAVTAFVYWLLVQPSELFDWIPGFVIKVTGESRVKLHKILFGCSKCIGGQLALWSFPIMTNQYSISGHFLTIIFAIFFTALISKVWQRI